MTVALGFPRALLNAHAQYARSSARGVGWAGTCGRGQRAPNTCCLGAGSGEGIHGPAKAGWGRRGGAKRRGGDDWSLGTTTEPASTAASSMEARNLTTPAAQVGMSGSLRPRGSIYMYIYIWFVAVLTPLELHPPVWGQAMGSMWGIFWSSTRVHPFRACTRRVLGTNLLEAVRYLFPVLKKFN